MSGYSITLSKRISEAKRTVGGALGMVAVKKDISVADIANKLGVSRTCVYDWFTGQYAPSPENLKRLKKLLDI
jgi:ribosome-binding protein aMBF1 (putative translation factor)